MWEVTTFEASYQDVFIHEDKNEGEIVGTTTNKVKINKGQNEHFKNLYTEYANKKAYNDETNTGIEIKDTIVHLSTRYYTFKEDYLSKKYFMLFL